MKRALTTLLLFVSVLCATAAFAQDEPGDPSSEPSNDDELRAKARALAAAGGDLYQQGSYADAWVKLDEAYRILRVPTLGFYSGRCLEENGRWVEAAERYREVVNLALPERSRELHAQARENAALARSKLLPRIPRVHLSLEVLGEGEGPVLVSLDGKAISRASLGEPRAVDPGEHVVVAARGDDRVQQTFVAEEGADERVAIRLIIASDPVIAPTPAPPRPEPIDNSGLRTVGYVILGVGGAALIGGVITGAVLLSEKSALDEVCLEGECTGAADVGTYNAMRPTTTALLGVGGVGVAVGLVLALAFPDELPEPQGAAVIPVIGPGWLGLSGRF